MASSSFSSPWPDPNSPVLSKIDFGVPLVELFKWLDVRDILLGQNCTKQDITKALALACDCQHPDAMWLTLICEAKDVSTKEDAKKVFSSGNDARALCFAWHLTDDHEDNLTLLCRAAEMGYAFACSTFCRQVWRENRDEAFRLAQFAAAQRERDGFSMFGFCCCCSRVDFEKDLNLAKENYLLAAELGDVNAAANYGELLVEFDPFRWLCLGRAALRGLPYSFFGAFSNQVEQFFSGSGNATIVFLIGRVLKGNIDMEKKEIFGKDFDFDSWIGPANQAISFYSSQIKSARLAVDTWTLVATRLHLIKDMRTYIGKMIWEARFEANYLIENAPAPRASPARKRSRK